MTAITTAAATTALQRDATPLSLGALSCEQCQTQPTPMGEQNGGQKAGKLSLGPQRAPIAGYFSASHWTNKAWGDQTAGAELTQQHSLLVAAQENHCGLSHVFLTTSVPL